MKNETPKKSAPKYILPSQRILNIMTQANNTGTPMSPIEVNFMTSLAILDKLEEVALILNSFRVPVEVKKEEKNDTGSKS